MITYWNKKCLELMNKFFQFKIKFSNLEDIKMLIKNSIENLLCLFFQENDTIFENTKIMIKLKWEIYWND